MSRARSTWRARRTRGAASLVLFPELGISAYAIDDLLQQNALARRREAAIGELVEATRTLHPLTIVGAPLRVAGASTIARSPSCAAASSR